MYLPLQAWSLLALPMLAVSLVRRLDKYAVAVSGIPSSPVYGLSLSGSGLGPGMSNYGIGSLDTQAVLTETTTLLQTITTCLGSISLTTMPVLSTQYGANGPTVVTAYVTSTITISTCMLKNPSTTAPSTIVPSVTLQADLSSQISSPGSSVITTSSVNTVFVPQSTLVSSSGGVQYYSTYLTPSYVTVVYTTTSINSPSLAATLSVESTDCAAHSTVTVTLVAPSASSGPPAAVSGGLSPAIGSSTNSPLVTSASPTLPLVNSNSMPLVPATPLYSAPEYVLASDSELSTFYFTTRITLEDGEVSTTAFAVPATVPIDSSPYTAPASTAAPSSLPLAASVLSSSNLQAGSSSELSTPSNGLAASGSSTLLGSSSVSSSLSVGTGVGASINSASSISPSTSEASLQYRFPPLTMDTATRGPTATISVS